MIIDIPEIMNWIDTTQGGAWLCAASLLIGGAVGLIGRRR